MSTVPKQSYTRTEAIEMLKAHDAGLDFEESGQISYNKMSNGQLAVELVYNKCVPCCRVTD